MSDDGSSGPRGEEVLPGGEPKGLKGAIARGVAAMEAWVRDGLLVSREALAQRWGISPEEAVAMVGRGELFELEAGGQMWVPAVFLELPRDVVAEVNRVLAEAGTDAAMAVVFWHRKHGALGGKAVLDAMRNPGNLERVRQLAESYAMPRHR